MKNKSKKIWVEAKKLIPTGNHLLSKHPDIFCQINGLNIIKKLKELYLGQNNENILICV